MLKNKTDGKENKIVKSKTKVKQVKEEIIVEHKIMKDNELIDIDRLEINDLPEGVKVATMCCSCFLGTKLNLDNIEKYMLLNDNDVLMVKRTKESIRTLIELKKETKRNKLKDKEKTITSNNFYNSITLIVRVTSGPYVNLNLEPKINIKLFYNFSVHYLASLATELTLCL